MDLPVTLTISALASGMEVAVLWRFKNNVGFFRVSLVERLLRKSGLLVYLLIFVAAACLFFFMVSVGDYTYATISLAVLPKSPGKLCLILLSCGLAVFTISIPFVLKVLAGTDYSDPSYYRKPAWLPESLLLILRAGLNEELVFRLFASNAIILVLSQFALIPTGTSRFAIGGVISAALFSFSHYKALHQFAKAYIPVARDRALNIAIRLAINGIYGFLFYLGYCYYGLI